MAIPDEPQKLLNSHLGRCHGCRCSLSLTESAFTASRAPPHPSTSPSTSNEALSSSWSNNAFSVYPKNTHSPSSNATPPSSNNVPSPSSVVPLPSSSSSLPSHIPPDTSTTPSGALVKRVHGLDVSDEQPPTKISSKKRWERIVEIMLKEVPDDTSYKNILKKINLTQPNIRNEILVLLGLQPSTQTLLICDNSSSVKQEKLLLATTKFAQNMKYIKFNANILNFLELILTSICIVLLDARVDRDEVENAMRICLSGTSRYLANIRNGAWLVNKLMNDLHKSDKWKGYAELLLILCRYPRSVFLVVTYSG